MGKNLCLKDAVGIYDQLKASKFAAKFFEIFSIFFLIFWQFFDQKTRFWSFLEKNKLFEKMV